MDANWGYDITIEPRYPYNSVGSPGVPLKFDRVRYNDGLAGAFAVIKSEERICIPWEMILKVRIVKR